MAAKNKFMSNNIKKTSLVWQQIAYEWKHYFTIPSRISPDEIKEYRKWLQKINKYKKPLKALVLGVTPELRDALFDLGYQVYSIDINLDMFLVMNELLENRNPNEVFVRANWLSNPLKEKFFDVVLGDAVLPNIPWSERKHFFTEIKRLLKNRGVFLIRAFYVPDKKRFSSVEEVFEYLAKKDLPLIRAAIAMVLELQILTYDPKDHLGSMNKVKNIMEDFHKRKGLKLASEKLQELHDMVWNIWCQKFSGKDWVYSFRKDEEKNYKEYFNIKEVYEAKDHDYSKITPMYFLKNK